MLLGMGMKNWEGYSRSSCCNFGKPKTFRKDREKQ